MVNIMYGSRNSVARFSYPCKKLASSRLTFPGTRDLQVQHLEKGDVGVVGMAETTFSWDFDNRPNARIKAPSHQQSRLGQSVSSNSACWVNARAYYLPWKSAFDAFSFISFFAIVDCNIAR